MKSTKKVLLSSAAATMAVTAGNTGAMAADAMLKKAPPIQYVRICDQYGAGFFVIPGTQTCLQLRGSIQIDNAFQANQNLVFMTVDKKTFKWDPPNQLVAGNQENWGFEVNVKPKFDARHETSWGTFRAYVELKGGIDAGLFNDPGGFPGPNPKEANTFSIFRAYMQWVGFSLGEMDSVFSSGGFKDGDIQNILSGEKIASYQFSYTWTPSGPGQPPKKGGAPIPDGWSATISFEEATKDTTKSNFGNGASAGGQGLQLANGSMVDISNGPIGWPDVIGRLHYEADPQGKDPNFNDVWSIGTFHLVGALHQIDTIATGSTGPGPQLSSNSGVNCALFPPGGIATPCTPNYGVTENSTGWAVGGDLKVFTPMWGPAKRGSMAPADVDSLFFEATYGVGALNFAGISGTNGSLQAGDAYYIGGLERDDGDFRAINNGNGTYSFDKESAFTFNVQYHHIITDCTDPVTCWRFNLEYNYAKVTPGQATQNTDWTLGGLGVASINRITANLIWGANRPPVAVPTSAEVSFEVQYVMINQDLPNNCNAGIGPCFPIGVAGNGVAAGANVPATYGVSQNTNGWIGRLTITKGW